MYCLWIQFNILHYYLIQTTQFYLKKFILKTECILCLTWIDSFLWWKKLVLHNSLPVHNWQGNVNTCTLKLKDSYATHQATNANVPESRFCLCYSSALIMLSVQCIRRVICNASFVGFLPGNSYGLSLIVWPDTGCCATVCACASWPNSVERMCGMTSTATDKLLSA